MKYTIEGKTIEIFLKNINELKPYEKNARSHDKKQIELLKKNIQEFGYTAPIVIDKDFNIIAGHGRLEALKELKTKEVPCVFIDYLNEKQVKALRLADNKLQEMSEWNMDLVIPELKELDDDLLELTGFDKKTVIDYEKELFEYTKKIIAPIYEIKGEKPKIKDLYSKENTERLLNKIEKMDISKEEKDFLLNSAYRMTIFNYQNIAEYYAHSNKDVQHIMEELALVIIDFKKAIEYGFVKVSEEIIDS
jgi:ParB-like chromosome segregation protein Spo0J